MHQHDTDAQKAQRAARINELFAVLPVGWERSQLAVAEELLNYLVIMSDQGSNIDCGLTDNGMAADLWLTIDGIEYFISVRKSANQLKKEGKLPPEPNDDGLRPPDWERPDAPVRS